jgi:hypothetical protein
VCHFRQCGRNNQGHLLLSLANIKQVFIHNGVCETARISVGVCARDYPAASVCLLVFATAYTHTHTSVCVKRLIFPPACISSREVHDSVQRRESKRKRAGARVELKEPRGKMWLCVEASEAFYPPQREGALGVSQGSRPWEGTRVVVILVSGSRPAAGLGSVRGRLREKGRAESVLS